MLADHAVTLLPSGEKPTVVSPLGVVPKRGTSKFRLTVNMQYVNRLLGNKVFKLERLKDLADLAERGDHAVSYDLMPGTITEVCTRGLGPSLGSSGGAVFRIYVPSL